MSWRERCVRLLGVLLLVPILGVLGLDLPRLHRTPDEAIDRAPAQPMPASRRETSEAKPASVAKSCPVRKPGGLPLNLDPGFLGPDRRLLRGPRLDASTDWRSATLPAWHARGPPTPPTV